MTDVEMLAFLRTDVGGSGPLDLSIVDAIANRFESLRAALKEAYEHARICYAGTLQLPHCAPGYCQCGKSPPA